MRKYLLPKEGKYYKANLHMHTDISDGKMTILETKEKYMNEGYSVVAFTDHEIMVPHTELSDENFLALTSTEISINKPGSPEFAYAKTYHLNIYSPEATKSFFNTFDIKRIWIKKSFDYVSLQQKSIDYNRVYSIEGINDIIKKANEEGCLVSYNHPVWSLQDFSDYIGLKGLWGIEWYNNTCVRMGYSDSIKPIDDLLRIGQNVFPLATDDAHSSEDCFGGFVMIKAEKLEYNEIFNALKKGDFYSSSNPKIDELTFEDGKVDIKTSPVKVIILSTDRRYVKKVIANDELLNGASFDINDYLSSSNKTNNDCHYIRLTIIDEKGNHAYTRAYYVKELID
jgi:hypothetical protein